MPARRFSVPSCFSTLTLVQDLTRRFMPPAKVCVAVITGSHGVRGAVKLKPFTADPEAIADYGPLTSKDGGRVFALKIVGSSTNGQWIATIKGVADRETAQAMRGTELFVDRSALPETEDEDEFYYADLIGLSAETVKGEVLGRVHAVHEFGAGDLLEVHLRGGQSVMVPFRREIVPTVDIAGGRVVIDPPEGLFDMGRPTPRPKAPTETAEEADDSELDNGAHAASDED
jgi:16S rRNA processing protein RimM